MKSRFVFYSIPIHPEHKILEICCSIKNISIHMHAFGYGPAICIFPKVSKVLFFHLRSKHCIRSVRIRSCSGPHFPAFGLNTERYSGSLYIHSKCGKIRTRITPNTNTFYAVKWLYQSYLLTTHTCRKFL